MKKIVVLNDFPIIPPDHGGKLRIYNIYSQLSSKYKVNYICFGNNKKIIETKINESFSEIRIPKGEIHKLTEKILGKLLGISLDDIIAMAFCKSNANLKTIIQRYLNNGNIVVLSLPYMFPAVNKDLADEMLVYESHNVEYALKSSLLGETLLGGYLSNYVKFVEGDLAKKANMIFVTSDNDKNLIKKIYNINSRIILSPNGTDVSNFDKVYENRKLYKESLIPCPLAIFLGSAHPPNVQAARTLINEIAPKTKEVYFLICGSVCWGLKNERLDDNVGLAYVISEKEKLELYRVADIALNPMISGSGTNIKMLEYMAAGLPIVTTLMGARGLDIESYRHAIICNISEFPEKILEIIGNHDLFIELSQNGRQVAEERYDWKKIAENMAEIFENFKKDPVPN